MVDSRALEVGAGIVCRVVVEMTAGKDHARHWQLGRPSGQGRELQQPASFAIAPSAIAGVLSVPIAEVRHELAVRRYRSARTGLWRGEGGWTLKASASRTGRGDGARVGWASSEV